MLLCFLSFCPHAKQIADSFSTAKNRALNKIYFDHKISFYCGCAFNQDKVVDQISCGYQPRKPFKNSGEESQLNNAME